MSAARRWIPRFAPADAERVLDIAQEYGFVREGERAGTSPRLSPADDRRLRGVDVVDAIEALQWLSDRGLFDESGVALPESDDTRGGWG